jgi:hypothetical protein
MLRSGSVDYTKCEACRLRYVEIVNHDPTEYTYIKVIPDATNTQNQCMEKATYSGDCVGYRTKAGGQADNNCATRGCRCSSAAAVEYKGADNDWYVKCG